MIFKKYLFKYFKIRSRSIKSTKICDWKEQLIFKGKFPSLNEVMLFELLIYERCLWDVKSTCELNFSDMCWNINGNCKKLFLSSDMRNN